MGTATTIVAVLVGLIATALVAWLSWYALSGGAAAGMGGPLTHHDSRQWTVRYEDGTTTTLQLDDGRFCLYGYDYTLKDTNPLTYTWKDGSTQTLKSWDGATAVWVTNHKDYPIIYWMLNKPPSVDANAKCKSHVAT